jgi:hypothetical protein
VILKDLFNARVKAQHSVSASETALREQNAELRRKLDDMHAERGENKQAADPLAALQRADPRKRGTASQGKPEQAGL